MFLVYTETLKMSIGDERLEKLANAIIFRDDGGIFRRENYCFSGKEMLFTEQQISCVSAYFTHISKAKTQLFSKLCVSRTLDIFLIPNCEFLPSVSFVYNQNGACIKTSSQVKPNSTIIILCLPKPDHPVIAYWNV